MTGAIAVIPARGGSKRIPRKNIKSFAGRPMIAYSIAAAKRSGCFERIVVSTDDEEIASVALGCGAEVPFVRPKELSDDYAGSEAVVRHALGWLADRGTKTEFACCIYATAPFVQARGLREAFKTLRDSGKDFAFTITSFPSPIQRALRINAAGEIEAMHPQYISARSQDLEPAYHDAGQFYLGRTSAFLADVEWHEIPSLPIVLPRYLVQDIDTPEDWTRAELLYKAISDTGEFET